VARSVAEHAYTQNRLAGTFFFSRNSAITRDAVAVIPTIVYQLASRHLNFSQLICAEIKSNLDVRDYTIEEQARILLRNLSDATPKQPLLIALDALDECDAGDNDNGVFVFRTLINTLTFIRSFKIFVTSRVEQNIENLFTSNHSDARKLVLHNDLEQHIVNGDIRVYLVSKLSDLARNRSLGQSFPSVKDVDILVERAGALFIYAATVLKYISAPNESPATQMRDLMNQTPSEVTYQHRMLDKLYAQIISRAATTSRISTGSFQL
jgi:hypothetical protein